MKLAPPRYHQKQSSLWWTRNMHSTIYFLRELTGLFISFYIIYFLIEARTWDALFLGSTRFKIISLIALIAAIFHTITWLWVTVKISPVPLPKPLQILGFGVLIAVWLGASYFLLTYLYV